MAVSAMGSKTSGMPMQWRPGGQGGGRGWGGGGGGGAGAGAPPAPGPLAPDPRGRGESRGLQRVEGDAGVAADGRGQRLDRLVVHVDCQLAAAAPAAGEGGGDEDLRLGILAP